MASKKTVATKSASSKSVRIARIAAVRRALTGYFLGSAAATEHFWNTANPSLGEKSPANLVKAGKLSKVEQYVSYLRKHTRSAGPKFEDQPVETSVVAFEGTTEELLERLQENQTAYRFIVVGFPNAESYYTYAPVYRRIIDLLPEILQRQERKEQMLYARIIYSFTADLPVRLPKLKKIGAGGRAGQ